MEALLDLTTDVLCAAAQVAGLVIGVSAGMAVWKWISRNAKLPGANETL